MSRAAGYGEHFAHHSANFRIWAVIVMGNGWGVLISATPLDTASGLKKVEFGYDYLSRRTEKSIFVYDGDTWVLDTTKTFVYDGWNVIKETTTTGGSTSTDYYVWGLDVSGTLHGAGGIGGLLAWTNERGTFLYLYDANGNVGQLVNASDGSIAARYKYDPFGNLLVADGVEAENNPFRFSTKYLDAEIGWYYYGFRYYDPVSGRWPTRDPLGEEGGLNVYVFVRNNPINRIDAYGLTGEYTVKGPCRIEILAGHYSETPDRIKVPKCSGATINSCFPNGGVDNMNDDDPENDVEHAPKEFDPEAFPGSQFRVNPYHERMDPETLIKRTDLDLNAAEDYARHLCESCCDQCTEIIIEVICFGELASPPPTPTPLPEQPPPGQIYIGSAYDAICIKKLDPYPCL